MHSQIQRSNDLSNIIATTYFYIIKTFYFEHYYMYIRQKQHKIENKKLKTDFHSE